MIESETITWDPNNPTPYLGMPHSTPASHTDPPSLSNQPTVEMWESTQHPGGHTLRRKLKLNTTDSHCVIAYAYARMIRLYQTLYISIPLDQQLYGQQATYLCLFNQWNLTQQTTGTWRAQEIGNSYRRALEILRKTQREDKRVLRLLERQVDDLAARILWVYNRTLQVQQALAQLQNYTQANAYNQTTRPSQPLPPHATSRGPPVSEIAAGSVVLSLLLTRTQRFTE